MARANPFRFSTKCQDDENDLVYYGYRYYSPNTGKWQSRDPIGAVGGPNECSFVSNDPIGRNDALGLMTIEHVGPGFQFVPPPGPLANYFWLGIWAHFDRNDWERVDRGNAWVVSRAALSWRIRSCTEEWFSGSARSFFLDAFRLGSNGEVSGIGDTGVREMQGGGWAVYFNPINALASWLRQISLYPLPLPGVNNPAEGEISLDWTARLMPASASGPVGFNRATSSYLEPWNAPFMVESNHKPWTVEIPDAWTLSYADTKSYKMKFEWSDCCGQKKRRFHADPVLQAGPQRKDRWAEGGPATEFYREDYNSGF